jgi:hypothetical protein
MRSLLIKRLLCKDRSNARASFLPRLLAGSPRAGAGPLYAHADASSVGRELGIEIIWYRILVADIPVCFCFALRGCCSPFSGFPPPPPSSSSSSSSSSCPSSCPAGCQKELNEIASECNCIWRMQVLKVYSVDSESPGGLSQFHALRCVHLHSVRFHHSATNPAYDAPPPPPPSHQVRLLFLRRHYRCLLAEKALRILLIAPPRRRRLPPLQLSSPLWPASRPSHPRRRHCCCRLRLALLLVGAAACRAARRYQSARGCRLFRWRWQQLKWFQRRLQHTVATTLHDARCCRCRRAQSGSAGASASGCRRGVCGVRLHAPPPPSACRAKSRDHQHRSSS